MVWVTQTAASERVTSQQEEKQFLVTLTINGDSSAELNRR